MVRRLISAAALLSSLAAPLHAGGNEVELRIEIDERGDATYQMLSYGRISPRGRYYFEAVALGFPRYDYEEISVGPGIRVGGAGQMEAYLLGHLAATSDGDYFQPALYLLDSKGRIRASFYALYYVPLGGGGRRQWLIDPLEVEYLVSPRVALGMSASYWRPERSASVTKVGPSIKIHDLRGATEFRISQVSDGEGVEFLFGRIFVF